MILKKKVTLIKSIRSTGGTNGLPGNYLINPVYDANQKPTNESWFSSREIRNSLLGNGLNPRIPCLWLVGCTLVGETLTIEQKDLDEAKAQGKDAFEYQPRNRKEPIKYKQVGTHNINMELDMTNLSPEKLYQLSDLSMKHQRQVQTTAPAVAAPVEDIEHEEIIDDVIKTAEELAAEELLKNNPAHETLTEKVGP